MSTLRFSLLNFLEDPAVALLNGPAVALGAICQWTNGSATVTRASGSFVSDGVKKRSIVSGTLATRFPANVRVSSVSALSLTLSSAATAVGSGTDSGTFTPNAPLVEHTDYPMANLVNGARFSPWKTSATPPATIDVEFDLGSPQLVTLAAVLGHGDGSVAGSLGASTVAVYSAGTYTGATPTWTARGTIGTNGIRDAFRNDYNTTAQFWMFRFTPRTSSGVPQPFSLGGLWAGVEDLDLGMSGFLGSSKRFERTRARLESGGLAVRYITTGYPGYFWKVNLDALDDATRAMVQSVWDTGRAVMLDRDDACGEIAVADSIEWAEGFQTRGATVVFEALR